MLVVDVHNHVHPRQWVEPVLKGAKEKTLFENGVPRMTIRQIFYQIDERVEGMDMAGVDYTVPYAPSTWERSMDDCKTVNDYMGAAIKKYPKRIVGVAHIPLPGDQAALDELKRCVLELGMKAAHMDSSLKDIGMDSKELFPFYSEVCRLDIPVLVHPGAPTGYGLCRDFDLQRLIGREFDLMLGVTRLIYGGVLDEFPDLKLVFSHLGGGISGLKARLKAVQPWVVHTDKMKRPFDAYFSKIYFDTAGFPMSSEELKCAMINIGPDQILFGSDYPADYITYDDVKKFKDMVLAVPMAERDRLNIMGGTASRLLKL